MIKFSKLIFAFSFLFILASCEKDDPVAKSGDLEGTWTAESVVADIEASVVVAGQTTVTTTRSEGSNMSYDLTFDGTNFTASGSYDMTSEISASGVMIPSVTTTFSDVSGSGTYSVNGDEMTIMGSFFEYDANGTASALAEDEQIAKFEINGDGKLVFSQDETIISNSSGFTTTSKVVSNSVWVRK